MKKRIVKDKELYSLEGRLIDKETLKNEVIGDFAKAFMLEVQNLIDERGKDEVLKICKRK